MKTILFDLDGTLLFFDKQTFTKNYFGSLANYLIPFGYSKNEFISNLLKCVDKMKYNNGNETNELVFWKEFESIYGTNALKDKKIFDEFYLNYFDKVNTEDRRNEEVINAIKSLKQKGYNLVVASNPVFPLIAQKKRLQWAGLNPDDFTYITSYETMHYSKPNLNYYKEILNILNVIPQDCLMIGNDVTEDMAIEELGVKVFLLTKYLENKNNKDISCYHSGDFNQLLLYISKNF